MGTIKVVRGVGIGHYNVLEDDVKVGEITKVITTYNLTRYYVSTLWYVVLNGKRRSESSSYPLFRDAKAALPDLLEKSRA